MPNIIALVDDDRNFLNSTAIALEDEGFSTRSYADSIEAREGISSEPIDLAVLDIRMPRMDGIELLAYIRKGSKVPVIFLTSKDQEIDELVGLRAGADDYLTKPVSYRLLVGRIRALLRRSEVARAADIRSETIIESGQLCLNLSRHECSWMGEKVELTATEFLVLYCLAMRPGQIKNRRQLMISAFGESQQTDERSMDCVVKRVRQKLKRIDPNFKQIETLYGVGYRFKFE